MNNGYDFIEEPGILLENWLWVPELLKVLSEHFESGNQIPDELANDIINSRKRTERYLNR
jgi:Zn-dependent oligopeptidase